MVYYVRLNYATFGLEVDENDEIIETPPIARWCKGKKLGQALAYWQRKGQLEDIKEVRDDCGRYSPQGVRWFEGQTVG